MELSPARVSDRTKFDGYWDYYELVFTGLFGSLRKVLKHSRTIFFLTAQLKEKKFLFKSNLIKFNYIYRKNTPTLNYFH